MRRIAMVLVALVCVPVLTAQQAAAPAFEVASVKPNTTEAEPSMIVPPRGSVAIVNVPLENVSRGVVDRTGLQGLFDVELEWSADAGASAANSNMPSIFTALQVIDSVERPTPD